MQIKEILEYRNKLNRNLILYKAYFKNKWYSTLILLSNLLFSLNKFCFANFIS